jgi:dihydrofolate synthase/folylpolyglutamate synthase
MVSLPRFSTLQGWLEWQETLHPSVIDLGLERVGRVADRLACRRPAPQVITVAGTNGKGSSVALLEAILRRAGYRVGAYTSPHLQRYNERIRIDGNLASDAGLCESFARIDSARGGESLTYFEFGTLAALDIMTRQALDVALLEVGLGGRLDAVNIVDAQLALITSIGLDHTEWLGVDRAAIACEKAGIMRAGRPAVCADSDPPATLLQQAEAIGAPLYVLGREFTLSQRGRNWHWQGAGTALRDLPRPALTGAHQFANAAGVLQAIELLQPDLPVTRAAIEAGLRWVFLPGRIQRIAGPVEQILDVSHNAQAAEALADALRQQPVAGQTYAVLGMMRDKDRAAFVRPLQALVDGWLITGLPLERASPVAELAQIVDELVEGQRVHRCRSMADVATRLQAGVKPGDRVLVCGSFYTVAEWLALKPALH